MSIKIEVDHLRQHTQATATGEISLADVKAHLDEEGDRSGLGYRELIDASRATATLSSEEVRQVIKLLKQLGRRHALGPTAIIVSNDLSYGVLRMLETLLDDVCKIKPFRQTHRLEANQWLASQPMANLKPLGQVTLT